MSVRDEPILYLPGAKRTTGGAVSGGNAVTTTKVHRLDGAEHAAAEDTDRLDATDARHGLLPKLSGDATDALRGDGTWGATPDLEPATLRVPAAQLGGGSPSGATVLRGDQTWRLDKLDATADPTADDDSGDGYSVGSRWINVTSGEEFVCVDATPTAAVWTSTTAAGAGATFGTPAIVLGTAAAAGSTDEVMRRDSTIVAFDATAPTTLDYDDSAATGSAAVAARRDHVHGMPSAGEGSGDVSGQLAGGFDGGGSAIAAGSIYYGVVPFDGTITDWIIQASGSADAEFDVAVAAAGTRPTFPGDSVVASAPPEMTGDDDAASSTLTGWTTALTAGDRFAIKYVSGTATWAQLVLNYSRP